MTSRIDQTFAKLRAQGRKGFIAYITAGDPTLAATARLAEVLEQCGVDVLELGVPFSDPLADGVVNQLAAVRAIEAGTTLTGILETIRTIRQRSQIPIVLFTYLNPIYRYGFDRFHADAAAAGADGVLLLDLPPDEAGRNAELSRSVGLDHVQLIAPTTPPERIPGITAAARGFIYYVSREGVTGEQTSLAEGIAARVALIKQSTDLPVAVGFGISTPAQAAEVAGIADAVVVGSAIVRQIAAYGKDADLEEKVAAFVRPIADAIRSA